MVNATLRSLYPRERNSAPTVQEAGWAPEPVWTGAENLALTGIRSPERPTRSETILSLAVLISKQQFCLFYVYFMMGKENNAVPLYETSECAVLCYKALGSFGVYLSLKILVCPLRNKVVLKYVL